MTRRRATPAEHHALTTAATALALLAWNYTPGPAALPATVLTYIAAVVAGAWTLRWDIPHTLAATHLILRIQAAAAIHALAWLIQAAATGILHALAAAHRKTLPVDQATI
jgi:hypothetical protein